jgi:chitinase
MISTKANRAAFIDSAKKFLDEYRLDGIDIDMEYPAAMEREAPASGTLLLTAGSLPLSVLLTIPRPI